MFQTTAAYKGNINGHRYDVDAGDVLDIPLDSLRALLTDSPGIVDPRKPLTADQAAAIRHARDRAADQEHHDRVARTDAVREWLARWTGEVVCPGDGRHYVGEDELTAKARSDGRYVVGCAAHVDALAAQKEMPASPELVDRRMRTYRVGHNYAAVYTEYVPTGSFTAGGPSGRKRLRYKAGEVVDVRADIAEWVNRDCPGTLQPVE